VNRRASETQSVVLDHRAFDHAPAPILLKPARARNRARQGVWSPLTAYSAVISAAEALAWRRRRRRGRS
jgi:hypothetical protein